MTYPIVLAHGVCRFDALLNVDNVDDPLLDRHHYFSGIRTMLKAKGYEVYHSHVCWGGKVGKRADDLKTDITDVLMKTGSEKVNIIAHSMGGLDSRHMLFNDRNNGKIHHRIASLTTISTPHLGSPFADWGLENIPKLIPFAKSVGLDLDAISDLTVRACKEFSNSPEVVAFETECEKEVRFQTYAGRQDFLSVFGLLKFPFYIIEKTEGDNDGLVSVESAKWKEAYFKGIIEETDHLNELGWWDVDQIWAAEGLNELRQRIHQFYAGIAEDLP